MRDSYSTLPARVRLAASQEAGSSSASGSDTPTTSAEPSGTGSFFAHFAARRHMQDAAGSDIEAGWIIHHCPLLMPIHTSRIYTCH